MSGWRIVLREWKDAPFGTVSQFASNHGLSHKQAATVIRTAKFHGLVEPMVHGPRKNNKYLLTERGAGVASGALVAVRRRSGLEFVPVGVAAP